MMGWSWKDSVQLQADRINIKQILCLIHSMENVRKKGRVEDTQAGNKRAMRKFNFIGRYHIPTDGHALFLSRQYIRD